MPLLFNSGNYWLKSAWNKEWVTVNWLRSCIYRHIQHRKLFYFGTHWHQLRDLISVGFKSHSLVGTSKAACGIQTCIFHYNQSVLKQMEDTCLKSPRVVWKPSYCARRTAFSTQIASSSCFGKSNGTCVKWSTLRPGPLILQCNREKCGWSALFTLLNPPQFKAI